MPKFYFFCTINFSHFPARFMCNFTLYIICEYALSAYAHNFNRNKFSCSLRLILQFFYFVFFGSLFSIYPCFAFHSNYYVLFHLAFVVVFDIFFWFLICVHVTASCYPSSSFDLSNNLQQPTTILHERNRENFKFE